jgi:hypothetical protein
MVVTMPDGRTQELTAAESGLATLTLKERFRSPFARRQLLLPVALTHPFCYPRGPLPHEVCYHCGRPKEGTMARTVSTETRQDCCKRFESGIEGG